MLYVFIEGNNVSLSSEVFEIVNPDGLPKQAQELGRDLN
jgi:hypothetical protein